ncbi:MAG: hypothetical protein AAF721_23930 [Myxococcota bacterium]
MGRWGGSAVGLAVALSAAACTGDSGTDAQSGDTTTSDGGPTTTSIGEATTTASVDTTEGAGEATSGSASTGPATDDETTGDSTTGGADVCDAVVGLRMPLPECSAEFPCTYLAAEVVEEVGKEIVTPSDPPACADPSWDETLQWDVGGVTRYACVFRPPGASTAPRPLVVFFHPGGEGADAAEQETRLLSKAANYDLSGTPSDAGYVLAIVQGRNLHFPTDAPRDGRHHDFYHRDLGQPSTNPDIVAADALIDALVDEGVVDTNRIHIVGWSNGAFFGQLYAVARHDTPTAGGNRVASAAVFAAGNPFDDIERDPFTHRVHDGASCKLARVPASDVPILLTYRTCDFATPCGPSDAACFGNEPGFVVSDWLPEAAASLPGLEARLIGGLEPGSANDGPATQCTDIDASCMPENDDCSEPPFPARCLCLVNHLRWPDGVYGVGSGIDNEPAMLDFLRDHPLR